MLLTRIRSLRRDERGSTMAAVLGLTMVTAVVAVTVMTASVTSASYSTASRANVQSKASADAGIDVAFQKIYKGEYICRVESGVDPIYTATVVYKTSTGGTLACPTDSTAAVMSGGTPASAEVTSVGRAVSPGTGVTTGNTDTVVATLNVVQTVTKLQETKTTVTTADVTPSGPAIYSYNGATFTGSGSLVSVNGSDPDIMIKEGDVTCSGGAQTGVSDFVVSTGALNLSGSCSIAGNTWVKKRLTISGGVSVGGTVVAEGVMISSGSLHGSVWSTSDVEINGAGTIGGNLTAPSLNVANGTLKGNAWVYGGTNITWSGYIGGNVTAKTVALPARERVGGSITQTTPNTPGNSPYTTPSGPAAPNWVDYSYKADQWGGFTVRNLSGTCDVTKLRSEIAALNGAKGVLLATGCNNGVTLSGADQLNLTNDLAIIADKISFTAGSGVTSSATSARLWLINEDTVANQRADCGARSLTLDGGFTMQSNIAMLMYSPCAMTVASGLKLYGQMYAGQYSLAGGATLYYKPIGLPGFNLSTGATLPTTTTKTETITVDGPTVYSAEIRSRLDVAGS